MHIKQSNNLLLQALSSTLVMGLVSQVVEFAYTLACDMKHVIFCSTTTQSEKKKFKNKSACHSTCNCVAVDRFLLQVLKVKCSFKSESNIYKRDTSPDEKVTYSSLRAWAIKCFIAEFKNIVSK